MNITLIKTQDWWASKASDGFIEIVSAKSGSVICTIEISDYNSLEEAKGTAQLIAMLPNLLNVSNVVHLLNYSHTNQEA